MFIVVPFIVLSGDLLYYFEDKESLNVVQLEEGETYSGAARRYLRDNSLLRVRGTTVMQFNKVGIVAVRMESGDIDDGHWYTGPAVQRRLNLAPSAKLLMLQLHERLATRGWGE